MKVIDRYKFALKLSNETELSVNESLEIVAKIPFKYLEMAINKYKKSGLLSLKMSAEGVKFLD